MNNIGIIAEYNPFHTGHQYHIEQSKKSTNSDGVMVIMSGNFVQRGAPAIAEKYLRASTAITGGADLVVELPTIYASQSAEFFSMGAVSTLNQVGIINTICFGAETNDCELLNMIADIYVKEPDELCVTLKNELKKGLNLPSARAIALKEYLNNPELDSIINAPNNILGIEYLKALKTFNSNISGLCIKREGTAYHDIEFNKKFTSATALRDCLRYSIVEENISEYMNEETYKLYNKEYNVSLPVITDDLSELVYHSLLINRNNLNHFMDVNSNILNKINNYLDMGEIFDFEETIKHLKSKELTYTRISRILVNILLGITNEDIQLVKENNYPSYLRVLAFNDKGKNMLASIKKNSDIPIITNLADSYGKLNEPLKRMVDIDIFSTNIYRNIVKNKFNHTIKDEFRRKPVIY